MKRAMLRVAVWRLLVLETFRSSLQSVGHDLFPYPSDHARIVVAVAQIVVERGEAVSLTGVFHLLELPLVELRVVDISPIEGRWVHREARSNRAVSADNHVVLPGAAIPIGELELATRVLHDARGLREDFMHVTVCSVPIAVPAILLQIQPGRHADKRFHFLQTLN